MEFINFSEIGQSVPFKQLLDSLNLPYSEKKDELKGEGKFSFIVNVKKNLFFCPKNDSIKGSVINFLAEQEGIDLRSAAKRLKTEFLTQSTPKREIPKLELNYCKELEDMGFAKEFTDDFEVGLVKKRSVMAKKIAFKLYDRHSSEKGYIGYDPVKKSWFYPKGFKRDFVYNLNRANTEYAILVADVFDCLHIINQGFPYTVALMAESATDDQINLLSVTFKRIMVIHKSPENIVTRLSQHVFIKAVKATELIRNFNAEKIKTFF